MQKSLKVCKDYFKKADPANLMQAWQKSLKDACS